MEFSFILAGQFISMRAIKSERAMIGLEHRQDDRRITALHGERLDGPDQERTATLAPIPGIYCDPIKPQHPGLLMPKRDIARRLSSDLQDNDIGHVTQSPGYLDSRRVRKGLEAKSGQPTPVTPTDRS
jgi:hypothetical protein